MSNIVKEMDAKGLIKEITDKTDKRRNVIVLSDKGKEMADILSTQCSDVATAIENISKETRNDLWRAIEEGKNYFLRKVISTGERGEKGKRKP